MMRAIALLLLCANLGYCGWASLVDAPATPIVDSALDPSSPRLVLASERPAPPPKRIATKVAAAKPAPTPADQTADAGGKPTAKCVSVGPFQDLPTVVQASAVLKDAGYESRQRLEQGEVWVGHWVSISGLTTHELAERAIQKLKDKGVTDAYILPGSDPPNVISLGVFKEIDRAQRRLSEAKSLGFNAAIADRTRAGSVYWVDVDLKDADTTLDSSILGKQMSAQPGKIVRFELRDCTSN